MTRVVVLADANAVAQSAAARLLVAVEDALAARDEAHIVLTGGTVGIATLAAAAAHPLSGSINWMSVHVWWGDERFVPVGDPDRNEGQAQEALLSHLPLPEENIHRMGEPGQFDDAEAAARAYGELLAAYGDPCPAFDVLMLGLGPDGHVASLFPGHAGLTAAGTAISVHDSPKPPPTRVSLGFEAIAHARQVWVVAAGEEKAEAVRASLTHADGIPGGMVAGTHETLWIVDAAAAAKL